MVEGGETISKPIYKMVDGKTRENREQEQELGSPGLGRGSVQGKAASRR